MSRLTRSLLPRFFYISLGLGLWCHVLVSTLSLAFEPIVALSVLYAFRKHALRLM